MSPRILRWLSNNPLAFTLVVFFSWPVALSLVSDPPVIQEKLAKDAARRARAQAWINGELSDEEMISDEFTYLYDRNVQNQDQNKIQNQAQKRDRD